MARLDDLRCFYEILAILERKIGGPRTLAGSSGRMCWPNRGVYFFQEPGEERSDTGDGPRIVRVGTHALKASARSTLWERLRQHKGTIRGSGNHRGSVFRRLVGRCLIERDGPPCRSWGKGSSAPRSVRDAERPLEKRVSAVIGAMPFLWLAVEDSQRGYIERNAIALLSNFGKPSLDPSSRGWLGRWSDRDRVKGSGLWNSNHVDEKYECKFLDILECAVDAMEVCR